MPPTPTLLVDDSPSFLQSAARFLAADDRIEIVGLALSGRDAIEQAEKLRPELVLMDLTMPEMNGLEATRHLKASAHPPRVVILTLHDTDEYRLAALEACADGYVAKSEFGVALLPLLESLYAEPNPLLKPDAQKLLLPALPSKKPIHVAQSADEENSVQKREKFRVLVVEDEAAISRLLATNLARAGLDCRIASDGRVALEMFESYDPHLVLLDIVMPELDGMEVCTAIRAQSSVPIIVVTAKDTNDDQLRGLQLGADDYVVKPFDVKLLTARVLAQLRRAYRYDEC